MTVEALAQAQQSGDSEEGVGRCLLFNRKQQRSGGKIKQKLSAVQR